MHQIIEPIKCSKCDSQDIVRPVNSSNIDLECRQCGHTSLKPEIVSKNLPFKWVSSPTRKNEF